MCYVGHGEHLQTHVCSHRTTNRNDRAGAFSLAKALPPTHTPECELQAREPPLLLTDRGLFTRGCSTALPTVQNRKQASAPCCRVSR